MLSEHKKKQKIRVNSPTLYVRLVCFSLFSAGVLHLLPHVSSVQCECDLGWSLKSLHPLMHYVERPSCTVFLNPIN